MFYFDSRRKCEILQDGPLKSKYNEYSNSTGSKTLDWRKDGGIMQAVHWI